MSTPPAKQPGSGGDTDPSWILIVIGFLAVFVIIVWMAAHTYIAVAYGWLRIIQFSIFKLIHTPWATAAGLCLVVGAVVIRWMRGKPSRPITAAIGVGIFLIVAGIVGPIFSSWFDFFWGSDPSLIQWGHLVTSSMYANALTLLAFIVPLCVWTVRRSLSTNPTNHNHYAKPADYTLHTFSDEMGKHYPHVRLFRKINLTARPIDSGKYRMADTEKQFAMKHRLLDRIGKDNTYKINSDRAAAIFRGQLGKLWRNFNDLSKWEVAVLSILVPRIAATDVDMPDEEYDKALETTNRLITKYWETADRSYDSKADTLTVDVTEGVATIRKYFKSPKVQRYFKRHAYVYSILYAMLADARALGVLPSDEFRWLRVVDRRLWLVMNNVGRNTAWTEISGVYCHYMHEIKKARPLERAEVNNAVKGLIEAIDGYKFSDDEAVAINAQLKADEEAKVLIDPKAVTAAARRLIFGSLRVKDGDKADFLEVALLAENGEVFYAQRCQPLMPIELIERNFHFSDEEMAALLKMPTSQDVKKKLIELVNGHDVLAFYTDELGLIPGFDRSAANIRTLQDPDDGMDLATTVRTEDIVTAPPQIRTAVDAAQLVRLLWIEIQKTEMRAAQAATNRSSGQ